MSDKVAESFNMARPFKSPQEERDAEPWVRRDDYDWMVGDRDTWKTEADNWKQQVQLLTADNCRLVDQRNAALADVERLTTERDNWQQRAETLERAAQRLTVENEGLRADALANAPQRLDLQQYANLKADHELQVTIIETLREALQRTESMLATAQAKQIDQRLQGFLSVIEQLSSQVQEMLP